MSSETEGEGTDVKRASPDNGGGQDIPATPLAEQDAETEELMLLSPNNKFACNRCYNAHRKVYSCLVTD